MPEEIYKKFIKDKNYLEKLDKAIYKNFINRNEDFKQCPNPHCHYYSKSNMHSAREIICKCGTTYCFKPGGSNGQESIHNGIYGLQKAGCQADDLVLIHDAVRPLLSQEIISSNIAICKKYGYAITGIKCREAILESEDGFSTTTSISRDKLIRTQTPQTFRMGNIIAAHEEAKQKGITNSVASCTLMAELGGREMHIVPGSEKNIKVTTVEDLEILKALMNIQAESWLK